jgi:lipoprotein signal peptidase
MKDKAHHILIIAFLLLCSSALKAQKLEIISQYVAMQLNSDTTMLVSGMFVFKNKATSQAEYPIFYPISKDKRMGGVLKYQVKGEVELVHLQNNGIAFNFLIEPDDIEHFWLTYTQECRSDTALFLFSSSKYWQSPLKEFQFTLILPDDWTLIESSFAYDETWNEQEKNYYRITRQEYLPPEIFEVIFERPPRVFFNP